MRRFRINYKEYLKVILFFALGVIIALGIGYAAEIFFNSDVVSYNNTASGLNSTDVQGALDELVSKCWTRSADYCPTGNYCETSFSSKFPNYTRVNQVCTTGEDDTRGTASYIDTGVNMGSEIGIYLEFKIPSITGNDRTIAGAKRNNTRSNGMVFYLDYDSSGEVYASPGNVTHLTGGIAAENKRYALFYNYKGSGRYIFNGVNTSISTNLKTSANWTNPVSLYLFGYHIYDSLSDYYSVYGSYLCISKCQLTNASNIVRDFTACRRNSDGRLGLCDEVNGVFYTYSAGPGFSTTG